MSFLVGRLQFVKLACKAQESLSPLCRRFGISRPTGYKWKARFEQEGQRGLRDRSPRPHRSPRRMALAWLRPIRRWRRQGPRGPQIRAKELTLAHRSNQVWTVDFKGWFRTQDGQRVEPLTARDLFSPYVLTIRLLKDQSWAPIRRVFLGLFRQNGYPEVIRVDNGGPFGATGPAGLSRLRAWWAALGVRVGFIAPGHPEQNAGHEQTQRVLKAETPRPASRQRRAQQRRADRRVKTYNHIRPHQGLGQQTPAAVCRPRPAGARSVGLTYPSHWAVRRVRSNGEIKWRGRKRFVGEALVGYAVGRHLQGKGRWAVHLGDLLIGELRKGDRSQMRPARYARRY